MTDLSPQAQVVLHEFWQAPVSPSRNVQIAAALRAAADQVVPEHPMVVPGGRSYESAWSATVQEDIRKKFLAIAAELDHCQQLLMDDRRQRHPLADRARATLAEADGPAVPEGREPASVAMQPSEPEAEGPSDEELN